ncbi:MAG: TraE/TraK family type IV conjugative transfer system protein [Gammaproteobacteria bacterium]
MIRKLFLQHTSNLFAENKVLKILMIAMIIGFFMNWRSSEALIGAQRTTLVPVGTLCGEASIGSDSADESYLYAMALQIGNLLGNVTPANVDTNFSVLLLMFSSDVYGTMKGHLAEQAKTVKRFRSSSYRVIPRGKDALEIKDGEILECRKPDEGMRGWSDCKELWWHVTRERISSGQIQDSTDIAYVVPYVIRHGKFEIIRPVSEVVGR